jgi:VanZ family protein
MIGEFDRKEAIVARHRSVIVPWLLVALWICVIWGHSMMPAGESKAESGGIVALLAQVLPWVTDRLVRKAAHFTEYAVLGALLFGAADVRRGLWFPPCFGLLAALTDETVQLFAVGRAGMVEDVWLDLTGFLAGWAAIALIALYRKKRRN